jgi:hypothetical protein
MRRGARLTGRAPRSRSITLSLALLLAADLPVLQAQTAEPTPGGATSFMTASREAPAEIRVAGGRLVRLDMLLDGISVIRTDVKP